MEVKQDFLSASSSLTTCSCNGCPWQSHRPWYDMGVWADSVVVVPAVLYLRCCEQACCLQVLSLLEDAKAGRPLARPAEAASPLSPSAAQNLFAATTVSHYKLQRVHQCNAKFSCMGIPAIHAEAYCVDAASLVTTETTISWLPTVPLKAPRQHPDFHRGEISNT